MPEDLTFEMDDLDIEFNHSSRFDGNRDISSGFSGFDMPREDTQFDRKPATLVTEEPEDDFNTFVDKFNSGINYAEQLKESHEEKEHSKALKKFHIDFFAQFNTGNPLTSRLAFEEAVQGMTAEDASLMAKSLVHQPYELNKVIPNIEMFFYKSFCSPQLTKNERKGRDRQEPLYGNVFAKKGISLGSKVYRSLLETVALYTKKKHFKKILNHLMQFEDAENIDSSIVDLIVFIGMDNDYPVLLGSTMKFLLQNGYDVSPETFKKFVIYLESCKGFEENAKRFIMLTGESENVQMDFGMLKPLFARTIRNKSGQEVLKTFEQFRKNLKLNK